MDSARPPAATPTRPTAAPEPVAPVHHPAVRSVLDYPVATGVLLLAAFLASFAATNSDLWLHLAAGRLVAAGGLPTTADPFTAVEGASWVNHAWLFDLGMYLLYRGGGGPTLVAAKAVIVTLLAAALLAVRRPRDRGYPVGALAPAVTTTLVLLAIAPLLTLRPAVASYLLFAALLLMLHRWPAGQRRRWPFPATVGGLFLVWVNVDGGFVFGLLLLAVWTVGAVLQQVLPRGAAADDPGEPSHSPAALAAALAAALVACLINPYHFAAFRLPTELAVLALPPGLRAEPFFASHRWTAFSQEYVTAAGGMAAAGAVYLLLAVGLASFAVNVGGWRWRRALAWTAFALLGVTFWRLTPYFALVGGPAIVLNLQAYLSRRRAAWAERPNVRAQHLRRFFAVAGRAGLLVALAALLVLAWPGWLAADARSAAPSRRVAWRAHPDPTMERLAKRLAGWYEAGRLRDGQARGFHLDPDFGYYCAWFCPAEKSLFDRRLTVPPAVAADYLALQQSVLGLGGSNDGQRPAPPQPDALLRRFGVTHVVLSGGSVLSPPPFVHGLGPVLFSDPDRWPAWAIDGLGVVCGWVDPARDGPDPFAGLRLDAVRRAVGDLAEKVPPPPAEFRPPSPAAWDRFLAAPAPPPAEAYEAGLWLAYRNARVQRGEAAVSVVRLAAHLGRAVPDGVPDLVLPMLNAIGGAQMSVPYQTAWHLSGEGEAGRAATVLAIRAARRAIAANPDHPEAFSRLAQAYQGLDSDPTLNLYQQLAAIRQAVARIPVVAYRRSAAPEFEEQMLQERLVRLYQQNPIPGTDVRAEDLYLEALDRHVTLAGRVGPILAGGDAAKQFESQLKRKQHDLEVQRTKVRTLRDDYENAAHQDPPAVRAARAAYRFGLAREALTVLQATDPKDLNAQAVQLMATLYILAGEPDDARKLLDEVPIDELPPGFQLQLRQLNVQAAAAVGDYPTANKHAAEITRLLPGQPDASRAAAEMVGNLVLPDAAPAHPLTRVLTLPRWGGVWGRDGQPAAVNNRPVPVDWLQLQGLVGGLQQYGDWLVRQGILALEGGDAALARERFTLAVGPEAPPLQFNNRPLGRAWLDLWE